MHEPFPTREQAEAALRANGLTPERTGAAGWELAVREAMGLEAPVTPPEVTSRPPHRQATTMTFSPEDLRRLQAREREHATAGELEATERLLRSVPEQPCPRCGGARFLYVTTPGAGAHVAGPCDCMPLRDRGAYAGIPIRYRESTVAAFDPREGKRRAAAWARQWDGRQSVVFTSDAEAPTMWGTGKTHLGVALLLTALEAGRPARFVYVPDFLNELRARFAPTAPEQADAYAARVASEPLLMLDDLGAEKVTDWTREALRTLFDQRWRRRLPTIVTTNCTSEAELSDYIGGAVVSRLRDATWLRVGGADMRGVS